MVLPGSRAATLPTVSLYSISKSKYNLMLPAVEGVDMDCEGLMKVRKGLGFFPCPLSHSLENT